MEVDQAEEAQLETLKKFWKQHGKLIIISSFILLVFVLGRQYWHYHKSVQYQKASAIYDLMLDGVGRGEKQTAKTQALLLKSRYSNTPYAGFGAFMLAKLAVEEDNLKDAKYNLRFVLEHTTFPLVQNLARTRLAKIQKEEGLYESALKTLEKVDLDGYRSLYEEIKGDIYMAQNKTIEAKVAYQRAIESAPLGTPIAYLQFKIEDLE